MARSTDDQASALRAGLSAASARLKEVDNPDLASYVDRLLVPGGWKLLRHDDPATAGGSVPMGVSMVKEVHQQVVAAVAADPEAPSVTAKVNEGLQAFLDGSFTMPKVRSTLYARGKQRSTLNVKPLRVLHEQVVQRGEIPSRVAGEYLMSTYRLGSYAPDARMPLDRGSDRVWRVPRMVREAIYRRVEETGWPTEYVVNEGFEKFLAGSFTPQPLRWTEEAEADIAQLKVRTNDDLYRQVVEAARNKHLRPMHVAVDYMLDEYGITDGVADVAE